MGNAIKRIQRAKARQSDKATREEDLSPKSGAEAREENEARADSEDVGYIKYKLSVWWKCDKCGDEQVALNPQVVVSAMRGMGMRTKCRKCERVFEMTPDFPDQKQIKPASPQDVQAIRQMMGMGGPVNNHPPGLVGPNGQPLTG